jgi:hypothetical protein
LGARYRISDGVRATDGPDGGAILDIRQGRVFALNQTGSLIFARLGLGQTEAQIVSQLSQELEAAPGSLARDLSEFVDHLMRHKLITVASSAGPPHLPATG